MFHNVLLHQPSLALQENYPATPGEERFYTRGFTRVRVDDRDEKSVTTYYLSSDGDALPEWMEAWRATPRSSAAFVS